MPVSNKPIVRAIDLEREGISRFQIPSMLRRGELKRIRRGVYCRTGMEVSPSMMMAVVSKLVPHSTICLLSSLKYFGLSTQNPKSIWIALPQGIKTPNISDIPLKTIHFSGHFNKTGIAKTNIDGETVKITNPVRTIVDCFRFRNKIGLDIAIDALQEGVKLNLFTKDRLKRVAKKCRIYGVMKPYMDMSYR